MPYLPVPNPEDQDLLNLFKVNIPRYVLIGGEALSRAVQGVPRSQRQAKTSMRTYPALLLTLYMYSAGTWEWVKFVPTV